MTYETIHCSTPVEHDDRIMSWKDDAPVREIRTSKGTTRLLYDDGRDVEVVRR